MAKLTFVSSLPAQYDKFSFYTCPYVVIRKFNSKYIASRLRLASIPDLRSVHASTEHGSIFALMRSPHVDSRPVKRKHNGFV